MFNKRPLATSFCFLLSLFLATTLAHAEPAKAFKIEGVQRIKQITNYCGPAALASVLQYLGRDINQETVGKEVYDRASGATSGSDLLLFARDCGFAAYSWNSGIEDAKKKIAAGLPVLVLQENSLTDSSGHYRVLTGYDDVSSKFYTMDPYYDSVTELSYSKCERLWNSTGHWALLVVPKARDKFKEELDAHNPVVHMDLSYAKYKRKDYNDALKEANFALALEPGNTYAMSIAGKIRSAMGAGAK